MPGTPVSSRTDYAIRLAERFDGRATYIDGAYIAVAGLRSGEGAFQVTRDARSAMRFAHTDAASRFCVESRTGVQGMDDRLRRLIRTYAIDIVAIRKPR
jgi:hypothetical protein